LIELGAVLILMPTLLAIHWYDDRNGALTQDPNKHVTIVPHGAWATLGHNSWRMLGRQEASTSSSGSSSGSKATGGVELILLLQAKVLDAKGGKELGAIEYEIRDRDGNVWSASGSVDNQSVSSDTPPAGSTPRVTVTAIVPRDKVSSVVLDLHVPPYNRQQRTVLDVLRFAH
jgi:hypothetical protein